MPGDLQSRHVTVGNGEHTPPDMRRTKAPSRQVNPECSEASIRQICRDRGKPRVGRAGGLFDDTPSRLNRSDDGEHGGPKAFAGSFPVDSGKSNCALTGRPADDDVCFPAPRRVGCNVVMQRYSGEVARQHGTPPRIALDKRDGAEASRRMQPKRVAADAGEKVKYGQHGALATSSMPRWHSMTAPFSCRIGSQSDDGSGSMQDRSEPTVTRSRRLPMAYRAQHLVPGFSGLAARADCRAAAVLLMGFIGRAPLLVREAYFTSGEAVKRFSSQAINFPPGLTRSHGMNTLARMTVEDIVRAFGGTGATAEIFGLGPSAVSNWIARNRLPGRLYLRISEEAKRRRIRVPAAQLEALTGQRVA